MIKCKIDIQSCKINIHSVPITLQLTNIDAHLTKLSYISDIPLSHNCKNLIPTGRPDQSVVHLI